MKRNPPYKRKWHAPMIHNLNYKGIWKPRDIPNPDYFELEKPDFEPISARGILFDNILITSDEKVGESTGWKPKFELEKEKHEEEDVVPGSDGLAGLHGVRIVEEALRPSKRNFLIPLMPFLSRICRE
ncbi:hypothetical protein SAY86_020439 [Trapa natans]|uniref:Uncharacterized protein n=1 Tax=Trapa natans TaxID=22666 RepID=A0AAN7LNE4_TRANT|nr:hypothetical protein SAY86_020439 [Trapa natans]